jgi:hypothetical protein
MHGSPVVLWPDCVEEVREKNREGNVLAVVALLLTALFVFGLAAIIQ